MIELQRDTIVQETRSAFHHAMQDRFLAEVQRLSGRCVTCFISNTNVRLELEIERLGSSCPANSRQAFAAFRPALGPRHRQVSSLLR